MSVYFAKYLTLHNKDGLQSMYLLTIVIIFNRILKEVAFFLLANTWKEFIRERMKIKTFFMSFDINFNTKKKTLDVRPHLQLTCIDEFHAEKWETNSYSVYVCCQNALCTHLNSIMMPDRKWHNLVSCNPGGGNMRIYFCKIVVRCVNKYFNIFTEKIQVGKRESGL